jgi:putative ABC transport system ATP-binding protein
VASASPLLVARDITVVRDGKRVVDGANVTLESATMLTIQGGSGSGKSTLLRAMATLIPIASGVVLFEGREVHAVGISDYRRRVAYVPQAPRMFDGTVADNLRAGPEFRGESLSDADVVALVKRVGLAAELAERVANDLSGGERLRVALARALANQPRVLLVDEPTSALDPASSTIILDLLLELGRTGTAVLTVTHSEEHAARLGGERRHMTAGVLAPDGAR